MTEESVTKDYFLKSIDITQSIIKRMSHNSFLIKGWTITLVVVTLLLKGAFEHVFLAAIPLITFWLLDGYYLRQERLYRKLYSWLIDHKNNPATNFFDMDTSRFQVSQFRTVISRTLLWFYGTIAGLIVIYCILNLISTMPNEQVITLSDNIIISDIITNFGG